MIKDQEVVAAVNACFNFDKLQQLPEKTKNRFADLIRHHRIGAVCFFKEVGFGLRVYEDPMVHTDGDEAAEHELNELDQVSLGGYWMRCPPSLAPEPTLYIIANKTGKKFLTQIAVSAWLHYLDADDDTEEPDEDDSNWTEDRNLAGAVVEKAKATRLMNRITEAKVVLEK